MSQTAVIYARVSTDEQTPDNQLKELRAVASRMQWQIVKEYVDHGVSGAPLTTSYVQRSLGGSLILSWFGRSIGSAVR
jgi:DNA invertase Pin-like site-specific DNA recombinase